MKHQEKKYLVEDFSDIKSRLDSLSAKPAGEGWSKHYYAQQPGNDVVKVVSHAGYSELHFLKEKDGKFTLTEKRHLNSLREGLQWLSQAGYDKASIVGMHHIDYDYADGIIGLYEINDDLKSVILDFPPGHHEAIASTLGIGSAKVIEVPYNFFLQELGKLGPVDLGQLLIEET